MPDKKTLERARADQRAGKSASTQAGEFVREEMHHIREGKHGARSTKQAIAIGLSKARRAGVDLPPPSGDQASQRTRESAGQAREAGQEDPRKKPSRRRSRATLAALEREPHGAATHAALARQARSQARKRGAGRKRIARKASRTRARTMTPAQRSRAARKAARPRARRKG